MKTGISFIFILLLITSASAANGTLEYYQTTIKNDKLEIQVHQGDTIYLGKTYDLSLVSGLFHQYAFWSNWKNELADCNPSKIVNTSYFNTRINSTAVYLDPKIWNVGDWYYWDAYECGLTYYDYNTGQTVTRTTPFSHDNKLAFFIVKPISVIPQQQLSFFEPITGYISAYG